MDNSIKVRKNPVRKVATDHQRRRRKRYFMESEEDESGERKLNNSLQEIQTSDKSRENKTKSENETCSSGFCTHYITLIEEKARNHKLNRKVEELEERILCLEELLMTQNLPVTFIKEEIVEEDELEDEVIDFI